MLGPLTTPGLLELVTEQGQHPVLILLKSEKQKQAVAKLCLLTCALPSKAAQA